MIKAIFFDFDGVLTVESRGSENTCVNLSQSFPDIPFETIKKCYRKYCGKLNDGPGKFSYVWPSFCRCIGVTIPFEIMEHALRTVTRNESMFELVSELKEHYTLGIITDNSIERIQLINEDLGLADIFDTIIVSGAVSTTKRKKTTTIYEMALNDAGCKAEESVFIDNQEVHLEIPAQMGMHTYFHQDAENDINALRDALKELGVQCA